MPAGYYDRSTIQNDEPAFPLAPGFSGFFARNLRSDIDILKIHFSLPAALPPERDDVKRNSISHQQEKGVRMSCHRLTSVRKNISQKRKLCVYQTAITSRLENSLHRARTSRR
jgi:hypothetical protein